MMKVIISPTAFHLEAFKTIPQALFKDAIVVTNDNAAGLGAGIETITEAGFDKRVEGLEFEALPCAEAALYFLWKNKRFRQVTAPRFSDKCYGLFLKEKLGKVLQNAGIPHIKKRLFRNFNPGNKLNFPCIIKPNFGFASQLVARLETLADLKKYLAAYSDAYDSNMIEKFRKLYLEDLGEDECRKLITEEDRSELTFVSIPFVVRDKKVTKFYPAQCKGTLIHGDVPDNYVVFEYPPQKETVDREAILEILNRLMTYFELSDGVFHSEFLCSAHETYLVEFSPRITGMAISKMISLSEGVDLAALSVTLFLKQADPAPIPSHGKLQLVRVNSQNPSKWEKRLPPESKRIFNMLKSGPGSLVADIIAPLE